MITDDLHRALIRALSVLYFGSDEFMQQLAENEFADCASTRYLSIGISQQDT